jgi:signal transduction histidine kinase
VRWLADNPWVKSSQTQTRTIAVQTTPTLAELSSTELAELVALERLTLGTVHTLHNAFATVLGEASFLEGKCKGDPELQEACQIIRTEVDRCARLTRALQMRRTVPASAVHEGPDLSRIVRDLSGLLRETISSRLGLRVETPEDLLLVRGRAQAIELLVILMVHHAAAFAPAPAELRLRAVADRAAGRGGVIVELHSPALGSDGPPPEGPASALPALALQHLASEEGAEIEAEHRTGARSLRLFLPLSPSEAGSKD